jgi:type VI secretion system secreted protein Hcp
LFAKTFYMALNAYLVLKGQKQGLIKGGVIQKGREGQIAVYAVEHGIVSPRDAASGQATGKRMHKPLTITKEIDVSTPLLYNALVMNENITELTLFFWTTATGGAAGGGLEKQYYQVKLTNASIASITTEMLNNKDAENAKFPVLEEVSFTYQKIEWTITGGPTSTDNWV